MYSYYKIFNYKVYLHEIQKVIDLPRSQKSIQLNLRSKQKVKCQMKMRNAVNNIVLGVAHV